MEIKPDIETRAAIDALMQTFYGKAMTDEVIGRFFTEVVPLDLEQHLPVIGDFWESVLLPAAPIGSTAVIRCRCMQRLTGKSVAGGTLRAMAGALSCDRR